MPSQRRSALGGAGAWRCGSRRRERKSIRDAEDAFSCAQDLDAQLFKLRQSGHPSQYEAVALLVEAVKYACYLGADLGPIRGGLIGSARRGGEPPHIAEPVTLRGEDLQEIGSMLGEALGRLGDLRLGDPAEIARGIFANPKPLSPRPQSDAHP